jgi:hypothetical protein
LSAIETKIIILDYSNSNCSNGILLNGRWSSDNLLDGNSPNDNEQMAIGQMAIGQMPISQMVICWMTIVLKTIGQRTVGQISFGQFFKICIGIGIIIYNASRVKLQQKLWFHWAKMYFEHYKKVKSRLNIMITLFLL